MELALTIANYGNWHGELLRASTRGAADSSVSGFLLETSRVFNQRDAIIWDDVFCSFLALALVHQLKQQLAPDPSAKGGTGFEAGQQ